MKELIRKGLKAVETCELIIAKTILIIMIAVVSMQVFFRYVVRSPLSWPEELSGFLLIWLTFIVADILVKRRGHMEVEYFTNKLPRKIQLVIAFAINLYILVFLVFLVVTSIQIGMRQTSHLVGAALKLPKTYYTMAATFSGISMCFSMAYVQWDIIEEFLQLMRGGRAT